MFRILGHDDLQDLLGLYTHLHRADEPLSASRAEEVWRDIIAMPGHRVLGVYEAEELIGSCALQIVPNLSRGGRPYGLMENVVVHLDHRRRGIGTALVQHALSRAWDANCYKVMLLTGVDNRHTEGFYEGAGFDGSAKHGYVAKPSAGR